MQVRKLESIWVKCKKTCGKRTRNQASTLQEHLQTRKEKIRQGNCNNACYYKVTNQEANCKNSWNNKGCKST